MPARNIIKEYQDNGIYHIYNRGVEKRDIFLNSRDYRTFLYFLKHYLSDPETLKGLNPLEGSTLKEKERKNFYGRIKLLSYCLMPNHFHLLIQQTGYRDISEFMKCVATNYSMYFNHRYDRVGSLFQGVYKAVLIKDDNYLIHLSKYIHLNPKGLNPSERLWEYEYSSYAEYLNKRNTKWIEPKFILDCFNANMNTALFDSKNYQSFVEEKKGDSSDILGRLILE